MYDKYNYSYSNINKEIEDIYDEYPDYYSTIYSSCLFKTSIVIFSTFSLLFFVFNLIYAYSYISITNNLCLNISDKTFSLTLEKWLLIMSYSSILFFTFFLLTLYVHTKIKSNNPFNIKLLFSFKYLTIIFSLFMLFWSICGFYMLIITFRQNCKDNLLIVYLWINTSVNIILYTFLTIFNYFL